MATLQEQPLQVDVYIRDKIQKIFIDYIIPLNILHMFRKYDDNILVQQDHDRVKAAVKDGGDSAGAGELLHRLYRYNKWFQCLLQVLRDPDVKMSHVAQMMEDALAPNKKKLANKASTMGALCQKRELNLLLIGKTGSGKSATGNSIFEAKKFTTSSFTTPGTQEVQVAQAETEDCKVTVVDCPGLGDCSLNNIQETEQMCLNMAKAMNLSGNGFHALLLVLKYGNKYTRDEKEAVQKFKSIFGEHIVRDFCIIVMTHGENFYMDMADFESPITFSDWLTQQTGDFQDLLLECKRRCILFQNKTTDLEFKKKQRKNLLSMVKDVMCRDIRYTPEHFSQAEKLRVKRVIEAKELYLRLSFSTRISELSKDLHQIETFGLSETKHDEILNMRKKLEHILYEINQEDQGTGVLNDLKDSTLLIQKAFLRLTSSCTSNQIDSSEDFSSNNAKTSSKIIIDNGNSIEIVPKTSLVKLIAKNVFINTNLRYLINDSEDVSNNDSEDNSDDDDIHGALIGGQVESM